MNIRKISPALLLAAGLWLAGCDGEPQAEDGPPQALGERQMEPQPTDNEGVRRPQQRGMPAADVKRTDDD
ncbi:MULTISPECIES: hypothetical protein [Thioalkalivibrio]|uniref:Lipoprotein n=1 Tax=Thioalkalivibrio halophilus TaxID=252474 RepID=A0A1V2ZXV5_9GAMM|nr:MULTISPECIES: hypothetical protein [Thioalkalivibrio]OOC09954.1 hypothetical protein B1A74_08230 [Thioalkalivibrio halophilus]PYG04420.1 hypothetical protein D893_00213 [Thioalkalivibrio sp. ALE21]